jgi:MHS family alpha-ketoglutarate permease-like MFS transporter
VALQAKSWGMESFYYWYVTVCAAISLVVYWRMADTQRTSRIGRD